VLFRITHGGSPDGSASMPSFGDRLTEDEIWSIIAYFQSLWPDKLMRQYKKEFRREMR
jgi:mono/diheme cytochrome c family protein